MPRSDFLNLARRALRRRKWTGAAVAMVVVGLEVITGTGRAVGQPTRDQVLHMVGERILGVVGPADAAALVGDGEFAILCADLRGPDEADTVARRIGEAMASPIELGGVSFSIVTGTRIATASAPGDTAETLISSARCAPRSWHRRPVRSCRRTRHRRSRTHRPAAARSASHRPAARSADAAYSNGSRARRG